MDWESKIYKTYQFLWPLLLSENRNQACYLITIKKKCFAFDNPRLIYLISYKTKNLRIIEWVIIRIWKIYISRGKKRLQFLYNNCKYFTIDRILLCPIIKFTIFMRIIFVFDLQQLTKSVSRCIEIKMRQI